MLTHAADLTFVEGALIAIFLHIIFTSSEVGGVAHVVLTVHPIAVTVDSVLVGHVYQALSGFRFPFRL